MQNIQQHTQQNDSDVLDVSTARKLFSQIVDNAYFYNREYIIAKRNIPLVKIIKIDSTEATKQPQQRPEEPKRKVVTRSPLFGILKRYPGQDDKKV